MYPAKFKGRTFVPGEPVPLLTGNSKLVLESIPLSIVLTRRSRFPCRVAPALR